MSRKAGLYVVGFRKLRPGKVGRCTWAWSALEVITYYCLQLVQPSCFHDCRTTFTFLLLPLHLSVPENSTSNGSAPTDASRQRGARWRTFAWQTPAPGPISPALHRKHSTLATCHLNRSL